MGGITYHDGDLIRDANVDVIAHQTNCKAVMGRGIAKQIHYTYPRVFEAYDKYCRQKRANGESPLGSCQLVWTDDSHTRLVANLFGQDSYGTDRVQTDYDALARAMHSLACNKNLKKSDGSYMSIGFPYLIGCALGGGDWSVVDKMIHEEFAHYPGEVQIWKFRDEKKISKARKIVADLIFSLENKDIYLEDLDCKQLERLKRLLPENKGR